jgi:GNAT superfamily N-acetyltransferase
MNAQVRLARPEDAAAIAEVLIESRRVFIPYAPLAHPPAEVQRWVAHQLVTAGRVHVAIEDGRIVAFLATSERESTSWVDHLYVLPGWQGRGLGGMLLATAHTSLRTPIRLYTFQANVGARRFYERHGYRAVQFSDGAANEERCPDVLYERSEVVAEA